MRYVEVHPLEVVLCRSQWPRGLRRRSAATRLLRSWVRIPPGAWMLVSCDCLLSGRGLCDKLFARPEEFYRLWCVVECYLETSWMRRPRPTGGLSRQTNKQTNRGRTIAQAVSHRPVTAEPRVRSWVTPCEMCGGQNGTWRFYSDHSVFPCLCHSTNAPYLHWSTCYCYKNEKR